MPMLEVLNVQCVFAVCRRLLRFCCYMVCCKSSCDAKRALRNPYALLFGRGTKVLKVGCDTVDACRSRATVGIPSWLLSGRASVIHHRGWVGCPSENFWSASTYATTCACRNFLHQLQLRPVVAAHSRAPPCVCQGCCVQHLWPDLVCRNVCLRNTGTAAAAAWPRHVLLHEGRHTTHGTAFLLLVVIVHSLHSI
jgi:hypothetical protein